MKTCWAIKNHRFDFYYGTWARRVDAIAAHVAELSRECAKYGPYPGLNTALNADQLIAWRQCRDRGDRCVKVRLVETGKAEAGQ